LSFVVPQTSENNLNVFKQNWSQINDSLFFGDKIYHNKLFSQNLYEKYNSVMYRPIKVIKGESIGFKQRNRAYNRVFSKAVSTIKEPIEAFFNWLIQKTDIQRSLKIRSTKGLLINIFGRISAVLFVFNS